MTIAVQRPEKDRTFEKLLPVIGTVAGSLLGPVGGAAGGAIGGAAAGEMAKEAPQAQPPGAMQRRLGAQAQTPQQALLDAQAALKTQPPEIQQQFGAPIEQALQSQQRPRRF